MLFKSSDCPTIYDNNIILLCLGKWLGSKQIRCNWATKGAGITDEKPSSDTKSVVELTNGSTGKFSRKCCRE